MALKQLPRIHPAAMDFQLDRWSPKTPPCEFARGHVEDPFRFEPGGNVVVARNGDEAARQVCAADALADCGGTDFGHVAVDDAGEFVENHEGLSAISYRLSARRLAWRTADSLRLCRGFSA